MSRRFLGALAALVIAGCDAAPPADDAGGTDAAARCADDSACDDGLYCNGVEACAPAHPRADGRGCAPGPAPCAASACTEATDTCSTTCDDDADGDGAIDAACGGTDCDDDDARRYPGGLEICDALDEDCDPLTLGADRDRDGHPSAECCNPDPDAPGGERCGDDCDDLRVGVRPGETEACNGLDDDCDGTADEGVELTFFRDEDGDGYGVTSETATGCSLLAGHAFEDGDCADRSPAVHPGADEACNGRDDDCDGATDPGCLCRDGEVVRCGPVDATGTLTDVGECAIGDQQCVEGALGPCVGAVHSAAETCNGLDDDCDGASDESLSIACFFDADDDGYALPDTPMAARCPVAARAGAIHGGCPANYTARRPCATGGADCATTADCNDLLESRSPAVTEACDAIDQNCDGLADVPRFPCAQTQSRPCALPGGPAGSGSQTCLADCSTFGLCTGAEICNGYDDNRDSRTDETFACAQGATGTACTTLCGTAGTGTCTAACAVPTGAACRAPSELCNYCDDDGVMGYVSQEQPLATSMAVLRPDCDPLRRAGAASCFVDGATGHQYARLVTGSGAGAIWPLYGSNLGYGPIEVDVEVRVRRTVAGTPDGGWAIVLADGSGSDVGAPADVGVMRDRPGLAIEWRHHNPIVSINESDRLRVRRLPSGAQLLMNPGVFDGPSIPGNNLDSTTPAGTWVTQRMRIEYTPDDVMVLGDQERLRVWVNGSASTIVDIDFDTNGTADDFSELAHDLDGGGPLSVALVAGGAARAGDIEWHVLSYVPPPVPTPFSSFSRQRICP